MGVEPVKLTPQEQETIEALAQALDAQPRLRGAFHVEAIMRQIARQIVREEIASLAGLVLRRTQETRPTRLGEHNIAEDVVNEKLAHIFGEALADFSGHTGSDDEPDSEK